MSGSSKANLTAEAASRKAFGERLRAAIPVNMTQAEFAVAIKVGLSTLQNWMAGKSDVGRENLEIVLEVTGVSALWLVTGQGAMRDGVETPSSPRVPVAAENDPDLYGRVLEAISAVYKEMGWAISLRQLGAEAAQIAAAIAADGLAPEDKPPAVKAAAAMLRRQLRDAAANPTTSQAAKDQA